MSAREKDTSCSRNRDYKYISTVDQLLPLKLTNNTADHISYMMLSIYIVTGDRKDEQL